MTDGKEPTHFHVIVAQEVHTLTRSIEVVAALNHHGTCVSYNMIHVDFTERLIATAGNNMVPLPVVLYPTRQLKGTKGNFDRKESTLAGTDSKYDTNLVLN